MSSSQRPRHRSSRRSRSSSGSCRSASTSSSRDSSRLRSPLDSSRRPPLPPCDPAEPRRRASGSGQAGGWRRWRRSRIRVFSWSSTKEEACDPLVHGYGPALSQGCRFPLQVLERRVARPAEDLDRSEVDESCEPAKLLTPYCQVKLQGGGIGVDGGHSHAHPLRIEVHAVGEQLRLMGIDELDEPRQRRLDLLKLALPDVGPVDVDDGLRHTHPPPCLVAVFGSISSRRVRASQVEPVRALRDVDGPPRVSTHTCAMSYARTADC